jgi:hypothetical protein
MSEAALSMLSFEFGGVPCTVLTAVLLPKDRHGEVDLRGNVDTFFWVSGLGETWSRD